MTSMRQLLVASYGQAIGNIRCDVHDSKFDFYYYVNWQLANGAFPLSPYFSLSGEGITSRETTNFIVNLLPEGDARVAACGYHKLSPANVYALAHIFGHEPAGAASFQFHGNSSALPSAQKPFHKKVSDQELTERIRSRSRVPLAQWNGTWYQCLAGVQDKLQVVLHDDKLHLVSGSLTSTHILKPETRNSRTPFLVANEHYCMSLAAAVGLSVAPVHIRRTPEPVLLIERFDRRWAPGADVLQPGRVEHRHVIDGCQALGLPGWLKYECTSGHHGPHAPTRHGASFEKLFGLLPEFLDGDAARIFLVRWALFNLIVGNSDAHGKNISFFQTVTGLALAPIYDLVSVRVYGERILPQMAMGIGDQFLAEDIDAKSLVAFSQVTGISETELTYELKRMATAIRNLAPAIATNFIYLNQECELVASIAAYATAQANRLLNAVSA